MSKVSLQLLLVAAVAGLPVLPALSLPAVVVAQAADASQEDYKVGDTIEAWHNGNGQFKWMKSTILEIKDGKYKIHYGGSRYNTTWITAERIKGSKSQQAKAAADSIPNSAIAAMRDLEFKIGNSEKAHNAAKVDEKRAAVQSLMWESQGLLTKAAVHPQFAPVQTRFWNEAVWGFDVYLAAMQEYIGGKTIQNTNWVKEDGAGGNMIKEAKAIYEAYKAYPGHDAATLARMEADLAQANTFRSGKEQQVEEEKLAKRQMPQDTYTGGDAAAIKARITAAWKAAYPKLPILAVRLNGSWVRDAGWDRTNTNVYWTDRHIMYPSVVCKTDGRVATIYPVLVARDNVKRGLMEVKVSDHGINSYVPSKMLLTNVK